MPKRLILIVEDEIVIVRELEEALENLGFTTCGFAPSGEEALLHAERERPDLALVDIRLRGKMDGTELAGVFSKRLNIPVIFITAFSNREVIERAKLSDPFGYIVKPVRESQLRVCLELAFERIAGEKKRKAVDKSYLETIDQLREQLAQGSDGPDSTSMNLERTEDRLHAHKGKTSPVKKSPNSSIFPRIPRKPIAGISGRS